MKVEGIISKNALFSAQVLEHIRGITNHLNTSDTTSILFLTRTEPMLTGPCTGS